MLAAAVAANMVGVCGTTTTRERREGVSTFLMSRPARVRSPSLGLIDVNDDWKVFGWALLVVYRLRSRLAIVDFPEPEPPTIAVEVPGLMHKLMSLRVTASGREG